MDLSLIHLIKNLFKGNIWVKNGRIHRVGDFEIPNEKI